MSRSQAGSETDSRRLRAQHRREHLEHLAWSSDLRRWRSEYQAALLAFARRQASELELEAYEAALDAHEVAIEAHEEMLLRHERMLSAEEHGGPITSNDMVEFQTEIEDRHARSRTQHERLERTHRAILRALQMLGRGR